ncbi:glycogen debranching enzyme N-terminal domain-containing protein [Capnocytophaga felis]|uniref:4-alpha-glucanotransferase n=1 Tax=Capnocytophaga felis TaxID=2267611 RepID=A0A5M4B7Y8_9FLAO|nr:glycogen debranching enzyme N-terminal domain-containing protein [Capnocytophaga felis]GET45638.1 4-alpha-glucanotransferase [Capnocytophaga felis]GET47199.1 4-alpha-glucanotransferase [Capnocytophaga felis]
MSYLTFKKKELINLEYSLDREFLGTNRGGGYSSSTLVFCNTRKYHGLLVVPLENCRGLNHILLSSLDETIIQHGRDFNFAVHQYENTYEPRGHKYIVDVSYEKAFTVIYQVGGVTLKKEILMVHNEPQVLIRYTLLEAHSPTKLRLNPLLAFRDIHSLSKANDLANKNIEKIDGGIKTKLYPDFPYLHLQLSQESDFEYNPNWNYNIFYKKEKERGYDYTEDLLTLGYFELNIKKGESVVFSASTEENNSKQLKQKFTRILNQRNERNSFEECLNYSATQFLIHKAGEVRIKEGYHWYNSSTRDTFIALPGIALAGNTQKTFDEVFASVKKYFSNGLFEKTISTHVPHPQYDADTSLWFFWTIQQYEKYAKKTAKQLWKEFGEMMQTILETYRNGQHKSIRMDNNRLIWSEDISRPLTWFDAQFEGGAIVPRNGYVVEVNALWYNAVCYALALAESAKDKDFLKEWQSLPERIEASFIENFWIEDKKYLADYVNYAHQNRDVRPNQLITCALDYSPVGERTKKKVLDIVKQELLTPRGLRSLSPKNKNYEGVSIGSVYNRDRATFNGSVHPWFIGFFIEAKLKLFGVNYISEAESILADFEEELIEHGVCGIAAIYDGNPPFDSRGCISKARNVAEILRAKQLIMNYKS